MNKYTTLFSALLATLVVSACSDGTVSGGGAGDTEDNALAIALITPLVGLYDLPDNWRGVPVSEAYLEIQNPSDAGVATTRVHQLNMTNNCIEQGPALGEITKDPFSDRLFLDSFDFGSSVVSIEDTNLVINLTEDVNDIDDDGNVDEPGVLQAMRLGIMVSELPETCQ